MFPDKVVLRGDGEDVAVVKAAIVDSEGRVVPTASNRIEFSVDGPAFVPGVGNGDPVCHEPDKASSRSAFNGLACAIIRTRVDSGTAVVRAFSDELSPGMVNFRVAP